MGEVQPVSHRGPVTVLSDVGHARVQAAAHTPAGHVGAAQLHRAGAAAAHPHHHLHQLGLAVALHTGHAHDLTGPHLEVDWTHPVPVARGVEAQRQSEAALRPDGPVRRLRQFVAHHQPGQLGRERVAPVGVVALRRADLAVTLHPSVPQHGHPVAQVDHFGQLVADEHDGTALVAQATQQGDQLGHLGGRQRGRGLIEDQHLRAPVEGLEDLHPLASPDREVAHPAEGIDAEAVAVRQLGDVGRGPIKVEQAAPAERFLPQHQVLGHGEVADEAEVLLHHADAQIEGVPGRVDGHRPACDLDRAGGGGGQPEQHLHQRGLARAVLPEQAVDAGRLHREVHRVVGHHTRIELGDAAHAHRRRSLAVQRVAALGQRDPPDRRRANPVRSPTRPDPP